MTETISLSFASILPSILRHLSVIGKRTEDKKGENVFSKITLSSAEHPILIQYLQEAAQNVTAEIRDFVSAYTETDNSVTFMVTNTRWNDPRTPSFVEAFNYNFTKYLVFYTVAQYLDMNFPELAKKYLQQALDRLRAIIALVFFKAPPIQSDESAIRPSVVTQTLEIHPTAIGTSSYVFYVPTTAIVDVFDKWGNLQFDVDTEDTTETKTVTIKNMAGNVYILSNRVLPYDMSAYDKASVRSAAGTDANVQAVMNFTVGPTDTLLLKYQTNH